MVAAIEAPPPRDVDPAPAASVACDGELFPALRAGGAERRRGIARTDGDAAAPPPPTAADESLPELRGRAVPAAPMPMGAMV